MDIERELKILIDKHKGKQVGLGEIRLDCFAEDCLKEIRRLKSAIDRQSEIEKGVCPDCGGSGVYQEYDDEYDRYHVYACYKCEGTGEIARQSVKSDEVSDAIEVLECIYPSQKEIVTGEYPQVADALDLAITALQAYQPWISVEDRLPEIPEGRYGVMCNVMVDNCSSTKVMSLLYEKDTVRGKTVCRWKWYGKISPWNVTHWKPLPEPPKGE